MQKLQKASIANNLTTIVDALRSSSDAEATTILARLRLGESVEELVQFLSTDSAPLTRDSLQVSTDTLEPYTQLMSKTALPILAIPAKHLSELASMTPVLDASGGPVDPTLIEDDQFLSVIFPREELRLSQKGVTGIVGERTLEWYPALSTRDIWSGSNVSDALGDLSSPYAPWTSYPAVRGGIVIPPSYNSIIEQETALASLPSELPLPSWALMTVNKLSGSGSMGSVFTVVHAKCTALLQRGRAQSDIFGNLPNVAALFDRSEYKKSSLLSQWAASMVHSVKLQGSFYQVSE